MKTLPIDTGAAWAGTVSTFVDGDVFRETNIDTCVDSIADRLGYLKTTVDGKASVGSNNVWTGTNAWGNTADFNAACSFSADITLDKTGAQSITAANNVTGLTLAHANLSGTGASNGATLTIDLQDGQEQAGGAANNHGGSLNVVTGAHGAGGAGAAGRPGVVRLKADQSGASGALIMGESRSQTAIAGALTTLHEFDRSVEGEGLGNVFFVEAIFLLAEVSAPPQQMHTAMVMGTFAFESAAMSQISTTTVAHLKGSLTSVTCNVSSSGGTKIQFTVQSTTENVTGKVFYRIARASM